MGGPRVRRRPPWPSDRTEYVSLNRRSGRFYGRWATPPTTSRAFATLITRTHGPDEACFLICRRADGAILGAVELTHIARGRFRSAYLGRLIGAPYARQGYMREALTLLLRHGFGRLRLHRVEANVQPGNRASRTLVRQLGFVREGYSPRYLKIAGRWRDHERWALLVEDGRASERRRV